VRIDIFTLHNSIPGGEFKSDATNGGKVKHDVKGFEDFV
jgi:hypothetical protein